MGLFEAVEGQFPGPAADGNLTTFSTVHSGPASGTYIDTGRGAGGALFPAGSNAGVFVTPPRGISVTDVTVSTFVDNQSHTGESATGPALTLKIRLLDTDKSYGMIEVTSPPHVPGPPPHFHKHEFAPRKTRLSISTGSAGPQSLPISWEVARISRGWAPSMSLTYVGLRTDLPSPYTQASSHVALATASAAFQNVVKNVEHYGMYLAK